jgi:hypothetical protein
MEVSYGRASWCSKWQAAGGESPDGDDEEMKG